VRCHVVATLVESPRRDQHLSTYYGGRAEVRRRGEIDEAAYSDYKSMYTTVCALHPHPATPTTTPPHQPDSYSNTNQDTTGRTP
jgi:hypothetical protein